MNMSNQWRGYVTLFRDARGSWIQAKEKIQSEVVGGSQQSQGKQRGAGGGTGATHSHDVSAHEYVSGCKKEARLGMKAVVKHMAVLFSMEQS